MKFSLASRSENWTLLICICYSDDLSLVSFLDREFHRHAFLMVLFIAPVTPELQCDPKLIHEIKSTAKSFAASGGAFFPS